MFNNNKASIVEIFLSISVLAVFLLFIFLGGDIKDKLAILGVFVGFISVMTSFLNQSAQNRLNREKLEYEKIANLTKDTYKELFREKINAYRDLTQLIRMYKSKQISANVHSPEDPKYYTKNLKEVIELLKSNEHILSKEFINIIEKLDSVYISITTERDIDVSNMQSQSSSGFVHEIMDVVEDADYNIINNTYEYYEELLELLESDMNKMRDKIEF